MTDEPPQPMIGGRQVPNGHSSVRRNQTVVCCAVCERTLLLGEAVGLFMDGAERRQVCRLCTEGALARGWRREGAPNPPPAAYTRGPSLLQRLRRRRPAGPTLAIPTPAQDAARRAAARAAPGEARVRAAEDAVAAGVELFNGSAYRRTVSGIAKSLGRPRVSVDAARRHPPGRRRDRRLGHLVVPVPRRRRRLARGAARGPRRRPAGARPALARLERVGGGRRLRR